MYLRWLRVDALECVRATPTWNENRYSIRSYSHLLDWLLFCFIDVERIGPSTPCITPERSILDFAAMQQRGNL
jgi:hypothetical protein